MADVLKLKDGTTFNLADGSTPRKLYVKFSSANEASTAKAKFTDDNLSSYQIITKGVVSGKYTDRKLVSYGAYSDGVVIVIVGSGADISRDRTIPLENIPKAAQERMTTVADDAARFALSVNDVQNGDVVKVSSTNIMYVVTDETSLNSEEGYTPVAAKTATTLSTARKINGTAFDGSKDITTTNWGTARNVTVEDADGTNKASSVSVNGGSDVTLKMPATIKAALTGNADTATKLQTARTISLTGDVTGSASFDGSANASIEATVIDGSHKHTKSDITDFPATLPNPTNLTVEIESGITEGTDKFTYDGSAAKTVNITKKSLGLDKVENKADSERTVGAASKLQTARKITLSGDATGETSFDGSANETITVDVKSASSADKVKSALTVNVKNGTNTTATTFDGSAAKTVDISKDAIGLGSVDNTADSAKNVSTAKTLATARKIGIAGGATGDGVAFDGSKDININVKSLDATKLTGTVPLANLPAGALDRQVNVANKAARLKLTTSDVQNGDTVQEDDTGLMFRVVDETKLSSDEGYKEYTAGSASRVPWSGVQNPPATYAPSAHTHKKSEITDFPASLKNPSSIKLQLNGGTTEGTNQFTYDGSAAKSINITPEAIGALHYSATAENAKKVNNHKVEADVPSDAKFTDTTYDIFSNTANGLAPSTASGNMSATPVSNTQYVLGNDQKWHKVLDHSKLIVPYNINLSSLDKTKFYPVTFGAQDVTILNCEIHSPSFVGNAPYNQNVIKFELCANGWSDTPKSFNIYHYGVFSASEITIGCIGYGLEVGDKCVWLRGGMAYTFYSNMAPALHTTDFYSGNEKYTVGPNYYGGTNENVGICFIPQKTIKDGIYTSDGITGNLTGNATSADTAKAVAWANVTDKPTSFTPSAHKHSADDINSGTLPVARGGTGAGDAATARGNLGLGSLATKSTDGNAEHVLHGDGTWGEAGTKIEFATKDEVSAILNA